MMRQQIKALTWEYFRECDWLLLATLMMIILGPIGFAALLGIYGAESLHTAEQPMRLYINFLGIAALAYITPHMHAILKTAPRNRALPVPTRTLAGIMFVIPIVVTMASNILAQYVYRVFLNAQWPILTTTLSVGALTGLIFAGGWWLRDFRWYKPVVFSAVLTAWVYWLLRHLLDARLRGPARMWDTLSAADVLVLTATVVLSWRVMVPSLSRYRRGEADAGWLFFDFLLPQTSLLEIRSESALHPGESLPAADTPARALSVMNRENFRPWVIGGSAMAAGLVILTGLLVLRDRGNPLAGICAMAAMFSGMVGMLTGQNMWMKKSGEVRPFLLTVPLSDRVLARSMMRDWMKASAVGWGFILSAACLLVGIYLVRHGSASFHMHYRQLWAVRQFGDLAAPLFILTTGLTSWVFTGLMGTISSMGRVWIMVWTWVLLEAAVIVVLFLHGLARDGSPGAEQLAGRVALVLAFLFCVATTLFAYARAFRRRLVTAAETLWSAVIVAALCGALLALLQAPTIWKIVWCCVAFLVVAPVAAIPCAVQWSRHR